MGRNPPATRERVSDPSWNHAAELGELSLAGAHRPVYLDSHIAEERFLGRTFPDAERLLTTWEDQYRREEWAGFLSAMGYHKTAPAVFAKALERP